MRSLTLAARCAALLVLSAAHAQETRFSELRRMLPEGADARIRDSALGDVDGDGDLDALLTIDGPNRLYLNEGPSLFLDASSQLPVQDDDTRAVALGDLDGDGDVDAYIGNTGYLLEGRNYLYRNDGTGKFESLFTPYVPYAPHYTWSAAVGDVDADGDLDVFVGNVAIGEPNQLLLNDGTGRFQDSPALLPADFETTSDVAFGDMDADGDMDVYLATLKEWLSAEVDHLYTNDGTGVFTDPGAAAAAGSGYSNTVDLEDADGDGDLDVLVGRDQDSVLVLNDGLGGLSLSAGMPPVGARVARFGDLDGDLDVDVAYSNDVGQYQLLNDGTGLLSDASSLLPDPYVSPEWFDLADLDGDQDLDLILFEEIFWDRLWLNVGPAVFAEMDPPLAGESSFSTGWDVATGDVDGNGAPDILVGVVGNAAGPSVHDRNRLYLNGGTNQYANASDRLPPLLEDTYSAGLVDVDVDGDLDALLGNAYLPDRAHENDGAGFFTDVPGAFPPLMEASWDLAAGDVDGDGDPDLVVPAQGGMLFSTYYDTHLFLNDGTGIYAESAGLFPAVTDRCGDADLVDLDGDGDLDVVLASQPSNFVLRNDGTGSYQDVSATALPGGLLGTTNTVALGDVDSDGDADLALGNNHVGWPPSQVPIEVLRNDGQGSFALYESVDADSVWDLEGMSFADMDGDGDLDLYVANQQQTVYVNDGTGQLTGADLLPAVATDGFRPAFDDFDGDGDLDVALVGVRTIVLTNVLGGQVAWRSLPRIGMDLVMELVGEPGAPWYLAYSPNSVEIPVPPYGVLELDPGALFVLGSGTLPAEGDLLLTFPIPDNPVLIGVPFHWQAIFGGPPHLSNRDVTTLTAF